MCMTFGDENYGGWTLAILANTRNSNTMVERQIENPQWPMPTGDIHEVTTIPGPVVCQVPFYLRACHCSGVVAKCWFTRRGCQAVGYSGLAVFDSFPKNVFDRFEVATGPVRTHET